MKRVFFFILTVFSFNLTIYAKNFSRIFVPNSNQTTNLGTSTYNNNWNTSVIPPVSTVSTTDTSSNNENDEGDDSPDSSSSQDTSTNNQELTTQTTQISSTTTSITKTPTDSTKTIVLINNQQASTNAFGSTTNTLYLYLQNGNNSKLLTTINPQDVTTIKVDTSQPGDLFISSARLSSYPSSSSSATRFLQPLNIGTNGDSSTEKLDIFTIQQNTVSPDNYLFNRVSTKDRTLVINNTSSIDILVRIKVTVTITGSIGNNSNKTAYLFYQVPTQSIVIIKTPDLLPNSSNGNSVTYNTQDFTFAFKAHQSQDEITALKKLGKNGALFIDSGNDVSLERTVQASTTTTIYSIQEQTSSFSSNLQLTVTQATNF